MMIKTIINLKKIMISFIPIIPPVPPTLIYMPYNPNPLLSKGINSGFSTEFNEYIKWVNSEHYLEKVKRYTEILFSIRLMFYEKMNPFYKFFTKKPTLKNTEKYYFEISNKIKVISFEKFILIYNK